MGTMKLVAVVGLEDIEPITPLVLVLPVLNYLAAAQQ